MDLKHNFSTFDKLFNGGFLTNSKKFETEYSLKVKRKSLSQLSPLFNFQFILNNKFKMNTHFNLENQFELSVKDFDKKLALTQSLLRKQNGPTQVQITKYTQLSNFPNSQLILFTDFPPRHELWIGVDSIS